MRIDSNQEFSNVGYAFLMFLTDYYKRVGKLKLTFDEMMVLNTVAAQLGYNLKFSESLSIKDLSNLKDEKITKIFKRSKLSILSIANILEQPKESVRRRVNRLISLNLLLSIHDFVCKIIKLLDNSSISKEISLTKSNLFL